MYSEHSWGEASVPPMRPDASTTASENAFTPLLPDLSKYDLTIAEALDIFVEERRKLPSIRTLQRHCQEGRFDCYKVKTTRNGNPVHEWIINSTSLRTFIQTRPEDESPAATTASDARDGATADATQSFQDETSASAVASPKSTDDASEMLGLPRSPEEEPDVMTTPQELDAATDSTLSRAELLIDNARLTAQLDAQSELVSELRDDKRFMREEITQHRNNDRLLADMHRETLQTLKAVSLAGRNTKIELPGGPASDGGSDLFRDVPGVDHDDPKSQGGDV